MDTVIMHEIDVVISCVIRPIVDCTCTCVCEEVIKMIENCNSAWLEMNDLK